MFKLLVGLGNPGPAYSCHRHNIGFMALDAIAARHKTQGWRDKFHARFTETTIGPVTGQDKIFLLQPQTFMNESGRAVQAIMQFYKIAPPDIIVLHDELDLPLGRVRIKQGGGAAGHNGLRSIDDHVGNNYFRMRLGIGHPGNKDLVSPYVLGNFAKTEEQPVHDLMNNIAECLPLLIEKDAAAFMNKLSLMSGE